MEALLRIGSVKSSTSPSSLLESWEEVEDDEEVSRLGDETSMDEQTDDGPQPPFGDVATTVPGGELQYRTIAKGPLWTAPV